MARPKAHVLVLDDDSHLGELLMMRLEANGYRVTVEATARAGLAVLGREPVDAMILDLRLDDADGLDVLERALERAPDVPVVILTAHGTIESAVQAMQRGAYGFLTKPFQDHELLQKLAHAVERTALQRQVADLRRVVGASDDGHLVGVSPPICRLREAIRRVARTDATVLITGESGTGKELAARSLHDFSPRSAERFVAINCGAIPAELMESELFGHVKGAFTGATRARDGLFRAARGGTLFLDEIGEATPAVQVRLLRVIEERVYTTVGSTEEQAADVRLIAATNRYLEAEVAAARFRGDLFYRLRVVPLEMPTLRERQEDIPLLTELFLERSAVRHGVAVPHLSRQALEAMMAYPWPGNVRELQNELEAALLLADPKSGGGLELASLLHVARYAARKATPSGPFAHLTPSAGQALPPLKEARDAFERQYLDEAMRRCGGNVAAAARLAGRNRSDFYDLLRKHQITPSGFKRGD